MKSEENLMLMKKIEKLTIDMNKKEDDIKNILHEKDNILQEMNKRLIKQENEIINYKKQIDILNKKIEEITNNNKIKEKNIEEINNKNIYYERNINDNIYKIKEIDKKIELFSNKLEEKVKEIFDKISTSNNQISQLSESQNDIINKLNNLNNKKKYNITFFDYNGQTQIISEEGTTINSILNNYLRQNRKYESNNNIKFLFNAKMLKLRDESKIENIFRNNLRPNIKVIGE